MHLSHEMLENSLNLFFDHVTADSDDICEQHWQKQAYQRALGHWLRTDAVDCVQLVGSS